MAFADDVRRFSLKTGESTDKVVRAVTLSLFNGIIRDVPVDTGRARGSFETTVGQPATTTPDRLDQSGKQAMAEIEANVPQGAGQETYIASNLPYIVQLEEGSSKQAPEGFVRRNMDRIQRNLQREARKNRV